jgi:hypothetical protein
MDATATAGLRPIGTHFPAVEVARYFTAEAAFLAACCPISLAKVAAAELERAPRNAVCVSLADSITRGGQRPPQAAWSLLNPRASEICVIATQDDFTLFAGFGAQTLVDETLMKGMIRDYQRATGMRWIAIVQQRMPWIAAPAAAWCKGLRGPTE